MLSLPAPNWSHKEIYEESRKRFRDNAYKERLRKGQEDVLDLGDKYEKLARAGQLSQLKEKSSVPPHIEAGDMQKLYKSGMLRKGSSPRKIYEKLKTSSPYRICPLCMHRSVKTLDHFLPKEKFGAYSVLPTNLIPCCRDCNSDKDEYRSLDRSDDLIHPYFDNVDISEWLGCEIEKIDGDCVPTFYVISANVPDELETRLIAHLTVLNLFDLYDLQGARELNENSGLMKDTFAESGHEGVKKLCKAMSRSRASLARNYWRVALWNAAANDDDYCKLRWTSGKS